MWDQDPRSQDLGTLGAGSRDPGHPQSLKVGPGTH